MTREIENLRNVKITLLKISSFEAHFLARLSLFLASDICKLTYQ